MIKIRWRGIRDGIEHMNISELQTVTSLTLLLLLLALKHPLRMKYQLIFLLGLLFIIHGK